MRMHDERGNITEEYSNELNSMGMLESFLTAFNELEEAVHKTEGQAPTEEMLEEIRRLMTNADVWLTGYLWRAKMSDRMAAVKQPAVALGRFRERRQRRGDNTEL